MELLRVDLMGSVRRLWFATRKMRLPIRRDALVLEVGSGDSPCPRSDVLLDVTLENHERVGGHTIVDRPFVLGLIERLPFRDKAFDYVIAFHVLEHSADPVNFLSEMERVAKAGYLETPSFWFERLVPLSMHRLEVGTEPLGAGERLVINQKSSAVTDSELHRQYVHGFAGKRADRRLPPDSLVTRFFWKDRLPYRILNPERHIDWEPPPEATRADFTDPRHAFRKFAKLAAQLTQRRRPIDLVTLLRCVDCGADALQGDLQRNDLRCAACSRVFVVTDGIPQLHPSGWTLRSRS